MLDINTLLNTIGATETIYPFRPVRCEEAALQNKPPIEGFVYFTTDTKKIYQVVDGKYIPMGGNSGIYYGQRYFSDAELEGEATSFSFTLEEIEGDNIPNKDDLILNIPDGCFYRVVSTSENEIIGERLTVAGSGGSGGGGGISSSIPVINDPLKGKEQYFITNQGAMNISFYCSSQQTEGNRIDSVEYYIGTSKVYTDNTGYEFNETITFDISPYTNLLSTSTKNTLAIKAIDIYGNESKRKNFYFYLVELNLFSDFDNIYKMVDQTEIPYPCRPTGGTGLTNRYIRITIAAIDTPESYIIDQSFDVKNVNIDLQLPISVGEVCEHGVYNLKASFCARLDDGQIISSPAVTHQIVYYETSKNTPLIAGHIPSTKISQYDTITINFMIVDEQSTIAEVDTLLWSNGEYSTVVAKLGSENSWRKTFNETGFYELAIQYKNQKEVLPKIEVVAYEGDLPTIDETNIELYLTAQGRSNSESNKDSWGYKDYEGVFENFLWGNANGWLEDDKKQTVLKLTNGAKFSLPTYHPFGIDATDRGLTIELDFTFSGVLDYSKPLIECLSYNPNGEIATGFHITGQKATLNSSINKATTTALEGEEDGSGNINETDMALQAFTQYYNENERIHLSYVIERVPNYNNITGNPFFFVYTYLNGVMSGIMKMKVDIDNESKEMFLDAQSDASFIKFDSTYGDISIYNIRVYRGALDTRTIINNYIADLTDIDEKIELYKINKIFDDSGFISLNAIQDISYQLQVPYVLLKGGSIMNKKFKDAITYTENPKYQLPLTKSDYRLMSMQMYDRIKDNEKPVFEVPISLEDSSGKIISEFKDIELNTTYKIKRGVQVYGQGTSSMVYPVKNLRLKFVLEEDFPIVYNGAYPVEIVCFKADFMDSSSSHNTGTANLIYDLLTSMNLRSPAQQFRFDNAGKEGVETYDLLTAIRGFPIVCFYAEGDSDTYTYIGRYNFNIDKATPEPFGFIPQKIYTGKVTTDDQGRERKEVSAVGLKVENINGMTVLPLDEEGQEIERDIVQCWEILNNDNGSPTKFLTPDGFNNFSEALTTGHNWTEYYEDRYPDAMVSGAKYELGDEEEDEYPNLTEDLENGIFRVAKWLNSTAVPYAGEKSEVTNKELDTPVFYKTRDNIYDEEKVYYEYKNNEYLEKIITKQNDASIIASESLDEQYPNTLKPTIKVEDFGNKVNNVYNQYTFIYVDNEDTENKGWYLEQVVDNEIISSFIGENLKEYGIEYTGTPVNTNTILVNYYETNDWSSSLYEKYTIDNENYRLAKFKAEFQEYFNLDFSLFYYVLTLVLLMMDSRAKNMMLASWDQTIWYPIFYDMDTALGVNNTGFNKFAYDTEDDPKDKVFNGFDSVLWNNFKTCFYTEICNFYSKLRTYLTINKLLKTYNADASDKWNEALTSADAEYKYIRPYEEGYYDGKDNIEIKPGQVSYLYAGQGKRTNHRSYWLNNRIKYFDSKCIPPTYGDIKPSLANTFSFRAYALPEQKSTAAAEACVAQTPANHRFNITALNNSYQSLFIGNIVYGPEYTLANRSITLGPTQVKHEVESYILNPDLISNLGDLSDKYLGQFNFPGLETRLTELNFGRSSRSHPTQYDAYYNNLLSGLNIGESCPYLQKVNIARCTGLKTVDLTKCPRLRELDAEGTKLTDISFPANSIIEKIYLPNTLTSLILTNQPYLTHIEFDNLATGSNSIQSIILDRITAMDTYSIVKGTFANTHQKTFYLTKVNWVIEEEDDFVIEEEKIKGIKILDTLLLATPRTGYSHAQALTGVITVNIAKTVNQFEIYEKYNKLFPNVEIRYGILPTIEGAKTIRFMDNDEVDKALVFYQVYTDGEQSLEYLTSKEGPNGVALGTPAKASTVENDYEFTGRWKNNNITYTTIAEEVSEDLPYLYSLIPTENSDFYPVYNTVPRKYTIRFYDYDGTAYFDKELAWNTTYTVTDYLYRDDSQLDTYMRWKFCGWSLVNYGDTVPSDPNYLDVSKLVVTGNLTAYAHYIQEDVRTNATDLKYFDTYNSSIKLKLGYELKGKITLPSKGEDGSYLTKIGPMYNNNVESKITHVFFLEDNYYTTVSSNAFIGIATLKEIFLPNSITVIESNAFGSCENLVNVHLNDNITSVGANAFASCRSLILNELPKSLSGTITSGSFMNIGNGLTVTTLPDDVTSLGIMCLSGNPNVNIQYFGSNSTEGSKLTVIGDTSQNNYNIFGGSGKNITEIYIGDTVNHITTNAFKDYGNNLTALYFAKGSIVDYGYEEGTSYTIFGFPEVETVVWSYKAW